MNKVALAVLIVFLSGCKASSRQSKSAEVAAEADQTIWLVVMGGYQSCAPAGEIARIPATAIIDMIGRAQEVAERLESERGITTKMFFSCYTGLLSESLTLNRLNLRYTTDPSFQQFDEVPLRENQLTGPGVLNPMLTALKDWLALAAPQRVFVIGHSYGGWTAMQTAHWLRNSGMLGGAITLDPISPVKCIARDLAKATAEFFNPLHGCTRAPEDFTAEQRHELATAAPWSNFYQTQFRLLHSGPIPELETTDQGHPTRLNQKMTMPATNPLFNNQHNDIGVDPRVWKALGDAILSSTQGPRQD